MLISIDKQREDWWVLKLCQRLLFKTHGRNKWRGLLLHLFCCRLKGVKWKRSFVWKWEPEVAFPCQLHALWFRLLWMKICRLWRISLLNPEMWECQECHLCQLRAQGLGWGMGTEQSLVPLGNAWWASQRAEHICASMFLSDHNKFFAGTSLQRVVLWSE